MSKIDSFCSLKYFFDYLDGNVVKITNSQKELIIKYYQFLKIYNQKINLTSTTEISIILEKQFLDCLYLCKFVNMDKKNIADIGSGAGFPAIFIKIIYPDCDITLFESVKKKADFLNKLIKHLGLIKIKVIADRVENYNKEYFQYFDIITSRAVGDIDLITKYSLNILKHHGWLYLMKGPNYINEINSSNKWKKTFALENIYKYQLPITFNELYILQLFKK